MSSSSSYSGSVCSKRVVICCVVLLISGILTEVALYLNTISSSDGLALFRGAGKRGDDGFNRRAGSSRSSSNRNAPIDPNQCSNLHNLPNQRPCRCTDPTLPRDRSDLQAWVDRHNQNVLNSLKTSKVTMHPVDFVLLGDSITERWNGLRSMGRVPFEGGLELFNRLFTHKGGSDLQGLAMGVSGDTTKNLLWHLDHDWFGSTLLQPKVVWLLIGTNDLGVTGCAPHNVVRGIQNVVRRVKELRPSTEVVVHGLLPRGEMGPNKTPTPRLGYFWEMIQEINSSLSQISADEKLFWYFEPEAATFLGVGENGEEEIMQERMSDFLHPSLQGMEIWGPQIADFTRRVKRSIR